MSERRFNWIWLVLVVLVSMACASTEPPTTQPPPTLLSTTQPPTTQPPTTLPRSAACDHLRGLAEQQRADWDRAADDLDTAGINVDISDLLPPFVRLKHATEYFNEIADVWGDTCMGFNDDDDLYGVNLRLSVSLRSGYLSNWCILMENKGLIDPCPESG